jgi:AGCS family alanine or glycine:cation symporter
MTALSATIGTGNIAGVATAIVLGGPGAVFWMWVTALFGMATKYAEAVLAVKYREVDELGNFVGGPMYYIKNGLNKRWHWLGLLFALFGTLASFGIGNMVQANSVADALDLMFQIPDWLTGSILMIITAAVIFGGIKRIAEVAAKLVPFMAAVYIAGAMIIILTHIEQVLPALSLIVSNAFTGTAAAGGFAGATIWAAIRFGVARGVFSNEAGLGSAPIAHAAAKTECPVQQGMIAMLGTFIDTILVCTMTALVIVISGVWQGGENGAALSALAFNTACQDGAVISLPLVWWFLLLRPFWAGVIMANVVPSFYLA